MNRRAKTDGTENRNVGFFIGPQDGTALKAPNSPPLVIVGLCRRLGVKTNSTLLQTTLRADFAWPFAENEV
jgi:hypothetical protein